MPMVGDALWGETAEANAVVPRAILLRALMQYAAVTEEHMHRVAMLSLPVAG